VLSSDLHVLLACAMVLLGGGAAWLMLEAFGGRTPKERSRLRAALHRALGRAFVAIYLVLLVSMTHMALERSEIDPVTAVHAALGMSLAPLLLLKILIVRRWEPLHRFLPLFGSTAFAITVVTVGLGLLATHRSGEGEAEARTAALPDHPGRESFVLHCAQCHALSRPLGLAARQRPDAATWARLIATMRERAASRGRNVWTEAESGQIAEFLVQVGQGAAAAPAGAGTAPDGDDHGRGRGRGGRGR